MTRMSFSPARTASSTTYWIAGLSTTGSISFGWALVAGRNLVPSPAAGMTAFLTFTRDSLPPGGSEVYPRDSSRRRLPAWYRYAHDDAGTYGGEPGVARADARGARGHPARRPGHPVRASGGAPPRASGASGDEDSAAVLLVRHRDPHRRAGAATARKGMAGAAPVSEGRVPHGGRGDPPGRSARAHRLRAEGTGQAGGRAAGRRRRGGDPGPRLRRGRAKARIRRRVLRSVPVSPAPARRADRNRVRVPGRGR